MISQLKSFIRQQVVDKLHEQKYHVQNQRKRTITYRTKRYIGLISTTSYYNLQLDGCLELNAHNTVFGSKRSVSVR